MSLNFLLVITCDGYDISIFIGMEFFREKCIICHGFWIFLSRKFSVTKSRIYSKALGSWSSYAGHHLLCSLRRKKIKAGRFALFYSPIPFRLFCPRRNTDKLNRLSRPKIRNHKHFSTLNAPFINFNMIRTIQNETK